VTLDRRYLLRSAPGAGTRPTAGPPGHIAPTPRRARVYRMAGGIAVACTLLSVAAALPAAADTPAPQPAVAEDAAPTPAIVVPTTAEEAKQAWLDAARRSEAYNEQVLTAQAAVDAAKATSDAAAADVAAAAANTSAEQQKVAAADAVVAQYQAKVDAFANASFRGARLTDLSVLLTAGSPDDYLDQASSLDLIASDQQETLGGALAARQVATDARASAQAAENQARLAKQAADQATADAQTARDALDAGKAQLAGEIAVYQLAFAQLSTADIDAAVASQEAANLDTASVARQATQAAQRDRAGLASDAAPVENTGPEFAAWAAAHAPSAQAGIAVEAALSRQGLPYVWGAVGPDTFDCSGLMLWAWQQAGIEIPRNSAAQAGLPEVPLEALQPGDLVTFYSPVTHVGMYVGDGKVLHASMPGVPIKVVELAAAGPNPTGHAVNR
jgi:cell wall-associated NlpC family hydrolase